MRLSVAHLFFTIAVFITSTALADLKGYWSFNDGAGTTLTDNSGGGTNGTLVGGQSWQPGATTKSGDFSFNTSGSYFNLGTPPALQTVNSQTISMWLQPSATIQGNVGTGRQNPWNKNYPNEGAITVEAGGQLNYYYGVTSIYQGHGSTGVLPAGPGWSNITIVRNLVPGPSDTLTWYINGVASGTVAATYDPAVASTAPLQLGLGYTGFNFAGRLDDTALWDEALTAGEVAAIVKATTQTTGQMYLNNINVAGMDKLFQVWEDTGSSTATVNGMLWKYVSNYNTSGHTVGDSWSFSTLNSNGIFLFLNAANNSGVLFEQFLLTPEPSSIALMGLCVTGCGLAMLRRRRQK